MSAMGMFRQPSRRTFVLLPNLNCDFLVHCLGHERAYRIRLFAVTAMVVCYALEHRHRSFILLFAFSCVLGSVYGFLQGAWPFGLVELVWSGIAAESGGQGEGRKPSPEGR